MNIKREKKLFKKIFNNFERVENIIAFLKEKLDKKSWTKLQEPLKKYQKGQIISKDLIKEVRSTIGKKFFDLFIKLKEE